MFGDHNSTDQCSGESAVRPRPKTLKDLEVQLALSLILGVSAFLAFCTLRPRWPALYAARNRRLNPKIALPGLTNSFFGWMPRLYRVTEEQVLESAGLDAFVFLAFFKMAIRLFATMAFFAAVVLWPINKVFRNDAPLLPPDNPGDNGTVFSTMGLPQLQLDMDISKSGGHKDKSGNYTYLWSYVVFTYFFVGLTLYSINWETFRIIRYRQEYLGTQSTVTDRTFRLSGIPTHLRSEERLRVSIEKLQIGHVETITLCRDWKELDELVEQRAHYLHKLETAWAKFLQDQKSTSSQHSDSQQGSVAQNDRYTDEEAVEDGRLLGNDSSDSPSNNVERPKVVLRHGLFGVRRVEVDAIDYYGEKLRRWDEKIVEARKRDFTPTDMALVTMDSVASCQMVIQARIDPRPGRLLTKASPSPSDLVWKNTYASRGVRRLKSWGITIFITLLTLIWVLPTIFLAASVSICTLTKVLPSFANWLESHSLLLSFYQTSVPVLLVSLLNVLVPYLYDWLSNHQGMISQGDVELSVISKNFFFTFFNTFFIYAVSKTSFEFWSILKNLQDLLRDTSTIPTVIAQFAEELVTFYISFVMLQGIGLMPFRILEVGSVCLYPIYKMLSKTPRDFAELRKPPTFQYGFYLPTALLVFNLCLIYSVVYRGFAMLVFGTLYFSIGYFAFKYMLLYAMDQPQHATGGAWRIICYRIIIGLLVFEVVMVGQISAVSAFMQSAVTLPLIPFTIWYSYYFSRRFEPLTKYIALRAIHNGDDSEDEAVEDWPEDGDAPRQEAPRRSQTLLRRGSTLDELKEEGLTFVNPSLVSSLQQPWIYKDPPPPPSGTDTPAQDEESLLEHEPPLVLPNPDRSLGIGEDNVWSDTGN